MHKPEVLLRQKAERNTAINADDAHSVREQRIEQVPRMTELWDKRNSKVRIYSGGVKGTPAPAIRPGPQREEAYRVFIGHKGVMME